MENLVFLRPYRVPDGSEEAFLAAYKRFVTHAAGFEGFVRSEVLRSLDDEAEFTHFTFIEVKSLALMNEAMKDPTLKELRDAVPHGVRAAVYEPVEF